VKREFLINIVLLFVINLMIKPIYIFGIEAKVQDLTGIQSYGLYFFYFNFIFLFQFINDPGLQSWNAQYIPKNRSEIQESLTRNLSGQSAPESDISFHCQSNFLLFGLHRWRDDLLYFIKLCAKFLFYDFAWNDCRIGFLQD
jgi:hypothetical protein